MDPLGPGLVVVVSAYVGGDKIGYVIVEWNQASRLPSVVDYSGTDDLEEARSQLARERARTAEVGRHESYAIGTVVLDEDTSEREW